MNDLTDVTNVDVRTLSPQHTFPNALTIIQSGHDGLSDELAYGVRAYRDRVNAPLPLRVHSVPRTRYASDEPYTRGVSDRIGDWLFGLESRIKTHLGWIHTV